MEDEAGRGHAHALWRPAWKEEDSRAASQSSWGPVLGTPVWACLSPTPAMPLVPQHRPLCFTGENVVLEDLPCRGQAGEGLPVRAQSQATEGQGLPLSLFLHHQAFFDHLSCVQVMWSLQLESKMCVPVFHLQRVSTVSRLEAVCKPLGWCCGAERSRMGLKHQPD